MKTKALLIVLFLIGLLSLVSASPVIKSQSLMKETPNDLIVTTFVFTQPSIGGGSVKSGLTWKELQVVLSCKRSFDFKERKWKECPQKKESVKDKPSDWITTMVDSWYANRARINRSNDHP